MAHARFFRFSPLCFAAIALTAVIARAQSTQQVTIVGHSEPPALAVAGFGSEALARTPLAASVTSEAALRDSGLRSIADLTRVDASLSDSYNAEGYWSYLSVRGFTLDNRFNYRRDGLPINAEPAIALDNKERIEVLKGTSGIQAGASAPGGLVNLVVKRPEIAVRSVLVVARERGGTSAAVDIGERFGSDGMFGLRVNAAYEHLSPQTRGALGYRKLGALAADMRLPSGTLIEAELESSMQSQRSVPGFSMLGDTVPSAQQIDPRANLNNQPWSQPVVLTGDTASLRITQPLTPDWHATAHAMTQRLTSDDRTAFPYGVYDPASYTCAQWCDRYAPDGTYTMWQYVSDNEHRRSDALDLSLSGRAATLGVAHRVQAGVLLTRYRTGLGALMFDIAGTGNIAGTLVTPPSPGGLGTNTNLNERSTEWYLRDAMQLSWQWSLWAGLRHSQLARASVATDGTQATAYRQAATLPWLALVWQATPDTMLFASSGQGLESAVVPSLPQYANSGQPLTALKSRQVEAGVKHSANGIDAALVAFSVKRPQTSDFGACDGSSGSCDRANDGNAVHRGIEARIGAQRSAWRWQASALLLHARREGSANALLNGLQPVNVPARSLRLQGGYAFAAGAEAQATLSHEGSRSALPDNSAFIPAWTRLDVGVKAAQKLDAMRLTWRAGIDNLTDKRAWKESPYQFGHVYLFPLAPRSLRVSLQADL